MYPLIAGVLLVFVLIAAYQDYQSYRISNKLILLGLLYGLLLNTMHPAGIGFVASFIGMAIGLLLLLPFYMLRVLGAGDVKLVAMVGAFVGMQDIFTVLLSIMVMGGLLAVAVALFQGKFRKLIDNLTRIFLMLLSYNTSETLKEQFSSLETTSATIQRLPYGIAIAAGTVIFLTMQNS